MSCSCNKIKVRTEEEKKQLVSRINRIVGQMNGIKNMIDDNRYCQDILIQLSAIDKSIKSLASLILDNHLHSCLINGVQNGDLTVIDEVMELFKRF